MWSAGVTGSREGGRGGGGGKGGREIWFHSTYLLSSLYFLTPCNKFCHTCPPLHAANTFQYTAQAFFTQITARARIKLLFFSSCSKGHIT